MAATRQAWPYVRSPTVHDLAVRHCFICSEEDTSRARPAIGWVHPCKCTLVAHEACLFRWIDSAPPGQRETRMKCSSCGSPYHIARIRSRTLGIIRRVDRMVARCGGIWFFGTIAGAGVSFVLSTYSLAFGYGFSCAHLMLGSELCDRIIPEKGSWPKSIFYQFPSMPLVMFEVLYPGLLPGASLLIELGLCLPPSPAPLMPGQANTFGNHARSLLSRWPLHPRILSILFPPISYLYGRAYKWLRRRFVQSRIPSDSTYDHADEFMQLQMFQADGDYYAQLAVGNDGAQGRRNVDVFVGPADGEAARPGRKTVPLGRTLLGITFLPTFIGAAGKGLRWLSLRYSWLWPLRTFLGARRTDLSGVEAILRPVLHQLQPARHWTDLEPVWWHSVVALGLIVVARDVYRLVQESLLLREFYNRKITDFPFTGVDLGEGAFIVEEA